MGSVALGVVAAGIRMSGQVMLGSSFRRASQVRPCDLPGVSHRKLVRGMGIYNNDFHLIAVSLFKC